MLSKHVFVNSLLELLKQNTLTLIKRVVSTCYMCGDEKKNIRDKKYDFLICFLRVVATYSMLSVFGELEAAHVLACIHKGDCEVDCSSAKTQ